MGEATHVRINIPDRTYQASARSAVRKLAESAGFTGHRLAEVEIIIAEITSNLSKHTKAGGYLLARTLGKETPGIEILSIDDGPGMRLPAAMMKDGQSTTKTLGQGLGAIKRLSSLFDLYSLPAWGTILLSRTYVNKEYKEKNEGSFLFTGLNVCKPGEIVSGDGWKFSANAKKIRLIIADGLGHGRHANEAAEEALRVFSQIPAATPNEQISHLHHALKSTRGAVVNVVYIDEVNKQLVYSGVGNISMKVISAVQAKGCFSYNGIVGHIMPSIVNNHTLQWQPTDVVVLHSDGISGRWDIQKYPAITLHHPLLLCAVLYKDHNRGNDDSTVVVGKMIKKSR